MHPDKIIDSTEYKQTPHKESPVSKLNKWSSYFVEGALLFTAFIFSFLELLSYFDEINSTKLYSFLITILLWFGQFYVKTFVFNKYNPTKRWVDFFEARFYPEAAYFFCSYGLVLILRSYLFNFPIGYLGSFDEITAQVETLGIVSLIGIVLPTLLIILLSVVVPIVVIKHLKKQQWQEWLEKHYSKYQYLIIFLLLIVVFTDIDKFLEIGMERLAEFIRSTGLMPYLLGSPILYYAYALTKGSPLAEKLSKI